MPIKVADLPTPVRSEELAALDPSRYTVSIAGAKLPPANSSPQNTAATNIAPVLFDSELAQESARKANEADRRANAIGPLPQPNRKDGKIAISLDEESMPTRSSAQLEPGTAGPEWLRKEQELRDAQPGNSLDGYYAAVPAKAVGLLTPTLKKYIPEGLSLDMGLTELGGGIGYHRDFTAPPSPDAMLSSQDKLRNRVIVQDRPVYPNEKSDDGSALTTKLSNLLKLETRLSLPSPDKDDSIATPLDDTFSYEGKAVEMVIKIQQEAGLSPNGVADRATLEAINKREETLREQLRKSDA